MSYRTKLNPFLYQTDRSTTSSHMRKFETSLIETGNVLTDSLTECYTVYSLLSLLMARKNVFTKNDVPTFMGNEYSL